MSGEEDYEGFINNTEPDWREFVRGSNFYGPTTLIDTIIKSDGSELHVDLDKYYPEDYEPKDGDNNIGENGTFSDFRIVIDKGNIQPYILDLEKEFNPEYLIPVFKELSRCGIISHYKYDNQETGDYEDFMEADILESRPSIGGGIHLFYNSEQGLRQLWDFDEIKNEMKSQNINLFDLSEVVEFLEKKYKQLDDFSEIEKQDYNSTSPDDNDPWCVYCGGEGRIGPFLDQDCLKFNGSGMSDPLFLN